MPPFLHPFAQLPAPQPPHPQMAKSVWTNGRAPCVHRTPRTTGQPLEPFAMPCPCSSFDPSTC
uniref:Uncharacterized protein n=1 Tax=Setaria italica TaxID=4555 RepID=K3Z198_SETIT